MGKRELEVVLPKSTRSMEGKYKFPTKVIRSKNWEETLTVWPGVNKGNKLLSGAGQRDPRTCPGQGKIRTTLRVSGASTYLILFESKRHRFAYTEWLLAQIYNKVTTIIKRTLEVVAGLVESWSSISQSHHCKILQGAWELPFEGKRARSMISSSNIGKAEQRLDKTENQLQSHLSAERGNNPGVNP